MQNYIRIKRLICTNCNGGGIIFDYFSNERWVFIEKRNLFRLKYGSVFVKISEAENTFFIDIWIEGGFGVILPYKNSIIGLIDKRGFNSIINEINKYMSINEVMVTEDSTLIKGFSQYKYSLIMILVAILLAISFYIFSIAIRRTVAQQEVPGFDNSVFLKTSAGEEDAL